MTCLDTKISIWSESTLLRQVLESSKLDGLLCQHHLVKIEAVDQRAANSDSIGYM